MCARIPAFSSVFKEEINESKTANCIFEGKNCAPLNERQLTLETAKSLKNTKTKVHSFLKQGFATGENTVCK